MKPPAKPRNISSPFRAYDRYDNNVGVAKTVIPAPEK